MFVEGTEKSNLANDGTFFGKSGAVAEDEATGQSDGTSGKKKARRDRRTAVQTRLRRWTHGFSSSASQLKVRKGVELRNL